MRPKSQEWTKNPKIYCYLYYKFIILVIPIRSGRIKLLEQKIVNNFA